MSDPAVATSPKLAETLRSPGQARRAAAPEGGGERAPLGQVGAALAGHPAVADVAAGATDTVVVPQAALAPFIAGLIAAGAARPVVVALANAAESEQLARDLESFLGRGVIGSLPAWDTLPFERVSPEPAVMARRLSLLHALLTDPAHAPSVLVASMRALQQRLSPTIAEGAPVVVRCHECHERDALVERLVALGYRREQQVEHRGELAVRGGILDVFPADGDLPVRLDLFGDEIERLVLFDPSDQRAIAPLAEARIPGCRELLLTEEVRRRARRVASEVPFGRGAFERLAEGVVFDGMESWLPWLDEEERVLADLLGSEALVLAVDANRLRARAAEICDEEAALARALAPTWGLEASDDASLPRLHVPYERAMAPSLARLVSVLPVPSPATTVELEVSAVAPALGDVRRLADTIGGLARRHLAVAIAASTEHSARSIADALLAAGLPAVRREAAELSPGQVEVVVAPIARGAVIERAGLALVSEQDLTGRRRAHRPPRPARRVATGFFDDLVPGAYVVHRRHGIARYLGVTTRAVQGVARDYLLLEFRGGDRLYLPVEQLDALTPYSGGEAPTLSRLGGADWQRTRARAKAAVHEVAKDLVELYRRRLVAEGHAFSPDTPWQRELEESFEYVETPDQLRAIQDVKADMEAPRPMDRLVCGDVGFGKTEVAIRAVFKAVQDGKQAAVLVPTTLLAEQHATRFAERFAPWPVRVAMLSRFCTPAETRRVLEGLADGSIDVVVGTHRLLSDDVRFRDLGLLVVDEEQRFGVAHKEAIKALAQGIDVLTLTANPIPRTLEMALTGIRELSLIQTPPPDRQPILAYVGEYDEAAVIEAIRRELLREGQVFYVHNRVETIEDAARRLRDLVPEARVAVAHGQMDEGSLEQVMLDFAARCYDVLVCTTIVESGLDLPSANALVVERADRLGLAQLHQLRGRVGRAGQRAYAYFFHPPGTTLGEEAAERLRTIGEHTELGSGFTIAMRDLEIRGAGNLLGRDQSGHIAAVGYDLYVQLVAEAVAELKGEALPEAPEVSIDVPVEAHLPTDYVPREQTRLEAYRRLASITDEAALADLRAEWLDRFGPLPPAAEALLELARLKACCVRHGVAEVTVARARPGQYPSPDGRRPWVLRASPVELGASGEVRLRRLAPAASYKRDARQLVAPLPTGERWGWAEAPSPEGRLAALVRQLLEALFEGGGALQQADPAYPASAAGGRPPR
jgi:transcription-repair coupling factor (superfamily II helicase)